MKNKIISDRQTAALKTRFDHCKQQLFVLDWISEGSVTENHPGTWRWTRKVKARTVTVALSKAQADAFRQAVANHRRMEKIIKEMRSLSQNFLLATLEGPPRRRTPKTS